MIDIPLITTKAITQQDFEGSTHEEYKEIVDDISIATSSRQTLVAVQVNPIITCDILISFSGSFDSDDWMEDNIHRPIAVGLSFDGDTKMNTIVYPVAQIVDPGFNPDFYRTNECVSLHWGMSDLAEGNYEIEVAWRATDYYDNEYYCRSASLQCILFYR